MTMPRRPSREEVARWGAVALIIITSWAISLTMLFEATRYACQPHLRTPTCNLVTDAALVWLFFQHYLAVLFAGFIVGRVTHTRILR
jgi:hypothetical protein